MSYLLNITLWGSSTLTQMAGFPSFYSPVALHCSCTTHFLSCCVCVSGGFMVRVSARALMDIRGQFGGVVSCLWPSFWAVFFHSCHWAAHSRLLGDFPTSASHLATEVLRSQMRAIIFSFFCDFILGMKFRLSGLQWAISPGTTSFIFSLVCQWILRLIPFPGYYEQCCNNYPSTHAFHFLWQYPREWDC